MAQKPFMSLKFGSIKYADYNGSPEALELSNSIDFNLNEDEIRDKEIEVIKAYNGKFFAWWNNKYISKYKAIEYLKNYKEHNQFKPCKKKYN